MQTKIPDHILAIEPYKPGKPLEEVEREYGIRNSVKLASNENPLGPSPLALEAIERALGNLHRYPDGSAYYLIEKLSRKLNVQPHNIILGNGSDEILGMLTKIFLQPGDEAVLPRPAFLMYEILVRSSGAHPVFVPLKSLAIDLESMRQAITSRTRLLFLTNPNNPTGLLLNKRELEAFLEDIPPEILVVLDEAYIEFVRDPDHVSGLALLETFPKVITLRTFSKAYGLAGLRIGYGVMAEEIASLLNRIRQPFNTSTIAQVAACGALDDHSFLYETISLVHAELDFIYSSLEELGIKYYPTQANFFMVDVNQSADDVFVEMLKQGVIVRSMSSYGFPDHIRVNVGLHTENEAFLNALSNII
jgi:histidinol-phosphate aminotransferase